MIESIDFRWVYKVFKMIIGISVNYQVLVIPERCIIWDNYKYIRSYKVSWTVSMDNCQVSSKMLDDNVSTWWLNSFVFVRFIRYFISQCFRSVGALWHTGPRMLRSWGQLVFYWFYKDPLVDPSVPAWGVQQQACLRSEAPLRVLLVFPLFRWFLDHRVRVGRPFFWPSRNPMFYKASGTHFRPIKKR